MSDFLMILEYRDAKEAPIRTTTKIDINLLEIEANSGFLSLAMCCYKANSHDKVLMQRIILPRNKVDKFELIDLSNPMCPAEYVELAVKEDLKNGKT